MHDDGKRCWEYVRVVMRMGAGVKVLHKRSTTSTLGIAWKPGLDEPQQNIEIDSN